VQHRLELPNSELGDGEVGLWLRALVPAADTNWVQVQRGARTQQVPFLVPNEEKAAYLGSEPADDARFAEGIAHLAGAHRWVLTGGGQAAGGTMVPDVLPYDPTRPVAYPDNGRLLTDDVVDPFMAILTNGKATDDKVGPHNDLLPEFPYLGPPHENRTEA
jgi:hypothetical protein